MSKPQPHLLARCPFTNSLSNYLALIGLLVCGTSALGRDFYVAADAKAGGSGSGEAPFQTLEQARDAIRAARKDGSLKSDEPVTVLVGAGVYPLEKSFELTAEDGGEAKAPVIYRAQEPGTARIRGGVTLDPANFRPLKDEAVLSRLDENVRGNILVCDLSAEVPGEFKAFGKSYRGVPPGPWLYIDGAPMTLARWPNLDAPNDGWAGFSEVIDKGLPEPDSPDPARQKRRPGSFVFDDPRPAHWNLDEGVWLFGYWTHDWSDEVIQIASYDKEQKVIALAAPHSYGIMGGTWGSAKRRFFALNALEELDAPGEWYLDRPNKQLYFYPAKPLDESSIVLTTLTQPLVKASDTKYLKFIQLAFEFGHGDGMSLKGVEEVEIAGCEVSNFAANGITINGHYNTVRSCDLFNLGKTGLTMYGGDRKTLKPAANLAENNHIHHYGIFKRTYAPGISVSGCGQTVRRNLIHDAPHNAILYSGNEHLFELNEIHHVVMETGDSGAFYTGRDWTSQGNVLRHNYIHHLGSSDAKHTNTMGVYLDDCDSGDTIEGNIFYRAGRAIMIGGGRDNPVLNNLVVECPIGLHFDARGMTWKQWNNPSYSGWDFEGKAKAVNYQNPPWSERYPRLAAILDESPKEPLNNPIRRNVFVNCAQKVCSFDGNVTKMVDDKLEIADNLAVNTTGNPEAGALTKGLKGFTDLSGTDDAPVDLGFADASAGDFTLKDGARLQKELPGFEPIPFEEIGLFQDDYRSE